MTEDRSYDALRMHAMGDVLREHRRSRPHLLAAVDGELRLTYPELDARVNRLAGALRARGIGTDDRVLWLGQNSVKLFEVFLACAKLGALACPANWRQSPLEMMQTVRDFAPKLVFWQAHDMGEMSARHPADWQDAAHQWIQHDGAGNDGYDALLASGSDVDDEAAVDPQRALLAIYTAAFDGAPNAALLSHSALMLQALLSARGQAVGEQTRYLVSGPMFHVGVLMGALATFLCGGCCVFVARIDPEPVLRLIERERITHAFLPPPVIEPMRKLNEGGRYDVSSLFDAADLSGASGPIVMPAGAPLRDNRVYGQTEISGLSVMAWLGGSGAGRPSPFIQVKILDEAGRELPAGQVGEIAVRGAMLMNGYLNRPAENADRSRDGWHRTRDLGKRLEDGSIAFVGPKTALIKSAAENIYPSEVEACLRLHPAVGEVCVIGVPDPTWGQRVKAVVVPRPGHESDGAALIEHCRAHIASYKKPSSVAFVDALPRTAVGAIDRAAVEAAHGGGGHPASTA
jgi:long-chain acyl-CoA synthetase